MSWWVSDVLRAYGPVFLLSWVFWILFSVVLHELAHGHTALRLGDPTPEDSGHMTFNPLVHMGSTSLLVFLLVGIAWGAMPVDPTRLRGPRAHAKVALAGPATNLALAAASLLGAGLLFLLGDALPERAFRNLHTFFFLGTELNVVLALFNLVPVPPLDGATVLAGVSGAYRRLRDHPHFAQTSFLLFLLLFWKGGGHLFGFAGDVTHRAFALISRAAGG